MGIDVATVGRHAVHNTNSKSITLISILDADEVIVVIISDMHSMQSRLALSAVMDHDKCSMGALSAVMASICRFPWMQLMHTSQNIPSGHL